MGGGGVVCVYVCVYEGGWKGGKGVCVCARGGVEACVCVCVCRVVVAVVYV